MHMHSRLSKAIARTLVGVMWMQPLLTVAADLRVDSSAGGNTHLTQAGNGVPVVNIATPTGKGLSHNKFTDYNVQQQGLILNNSTEKYTPTQLGGLIMGNTRLQGQSARLILNEVTGGQASQLKGYTEVAGQQAHVVVANPHGLTCDGCGFINTPHATLTTGKPIIEQGQLKRYEVDGGQIEISGAGLNASNVSQFDLITHSAKINADLYADQLNIITGRNSVEAATLAATAKTDRPEHKPHLAIDSSALGGMYAGAIRLIGTEAGVGVKLAGDMAASAGDIQIDASGKLTLARASAQQNVALNAPEIEFTGQVYAADQVKVQAQEITNKSNLLAANRIDLAVDKIDNQGLIEAGLRADNTLNSSADIRIISTHLANSGSVLARGDLQIDSKKQVTNSNGQLIAGADLTLSTQQLDNQEGTLVADAGVTLKGQSLQNNAGRITSQNTIQVDYAQLDNTQGLIATGQQLTVTTDTVNNTQGELYAGGNLTLDTQLLQQEQGQILSAHEISLRAKTLDNSQDSLIHAATLLNIQAEQLNNQQGSISAEEAIDLQVVNDLDNSGQIASRSIILNANNLLNTAGQIHAEKTLTATLAEQLLNQQNASMTSGQELLLTADTVDNHDSVMASAGLLSVFAQYVSNQQHGTITANEQLQLHAEQSVSNAGSLGSGQQLNISTPHLLNEHGLMFSGTDLSLYVDQFTNRYADVYSFGAIDVAGYAQNSAAQRVENLSGSIESVGDFSLHSAVVENRRDIFQLNDQGRYSASITELPCGSFYNAGDCSISSKEGRRQSVWKITERDKLEVIDSSEAAHIFAGGHLSFSGGELVNSSSVISSSGDLDLTFDHVSNVGVQPVDIEVQRIYVAPRQKRKGYQGNQNTAAHFNAKHASAVQTDAIESDISQFIGRTLNHKGKGSPTEFLPGRQYIEIPQSGEDYSAIIQAGGQVTIEAQQTLDNSVIRPSYNYVSGGERVDTSTPGSAYATEVTFNSQLPPDLQQKYIDPTRLPNFKLPVGDQGRFRLSERNVQNMQAQLEGTVPVPGEFEDLYGLHHHNHEHRYLIESNPALTHMQQFVSSDYLLDGLGIHIDQLQKRLGDGLYEQKLMRDALIARTGQRFIAGLSSDEAMYRYLMDNAIASHEALNLSVGVSLSAEQIAALTQDIIWLEKREVLGEQVLTPVLYLAQAEHRLAPSGALIQGRNVALNAGADFNNQGTVRADHNLLASAYNITNRGLIQADQHLALLSESTIHNHRGGILAASDIDLAARSADIVNERSITRHLSASGSSLWETSFADTAARIEAARSLNLTAGRDIQNLGGVLHSAGDLHIHATRDAVLASVEERHSTSRGHHYLNAQSQQLGSETQAQGHLNIYAGRDLTTVASRVESGADMELVAGRDLSLVAATDEKHSYSKSKKTTSQRDQVRQVGTDVQAGGQLTAIAGQDLTLISSSIAAGEDAYLAADGNVRMLAAQNQDYSFYQKKKKGGFGRKSLKSDEYLKTTHVGSNVSSGGLLDITSVGKQRYQAVNLNSGADLILESGADIVFEGVKDLEQKSRIRSKSSWAWQSAKGKGHTDAFLLQSQLQAQGEIAIRAAEKIQIDIKEIDQHSVTQAIDAMVQADPQLAWLKEMEQRGDVDWREVKELHDSFSYSHSGLGGPAAMVVAIVASYYIAGAASGIFNSAAGATAGSGTAMASAGEATAAAITAGAKAGSTVASGWANATFSGVVGGSAGGAAGAISQGQDWRKPALTGGITGGFTGYLSAGTYYNNPIHTAGNVGKYLGRGEWMSLSKELTKVGMNQAFGYGLSKVAKEVGLTAEELNWVLMAGSILGNQWGKVGTRFADGEENFSKTNMIGIKGVGNRDNVILGLPFDVMDITLGYQGLPDASVQDYLSTLGADNKLSSGHSLGTLTNIYLGSNGLTDKVYLYSVPFGAVAPPNAEVMLGSWDFVNGGWAGKLLNWDAKVIPLAPWEHSFENYKKHITE